MPGAVVAKAKGRTGMESDTDLIQTALANLTLPDYFRTGCSLRIPWLMRNATDFHFLRQLGPSRRILFYGVIRVGILKPIEHLILDDSISEVMVNGGDRVFIGESWLSQHPRQVHPRRRAHSSDRRYGRNSIEPRQPGRFEARRPDNGVPGIAIRDL